MPSDRRTFLSAVGAGSAALAGCSRLGGAPSPDDPPPAGVDDLPDPGRHILGANGRWSSFGCNAANSRAVADGEAPVDGVTERWRTEVAQTAYHEPVVANGRIYHPDVYTLRVFDADDGSPLWTFEDIATAPLVRDGVAYVSRRDRTVHALDAETGDRLWERAFERPGRVRTPSTYAGDELLCGVGEHVVALDPEDGEVLWERELFGNLLNHPAHVTGYWIAVATDAGTVYLLGEAGTGYRRWNLPAPPTCPLSADKNRVYVNCEDGLTYALDPEQTDEPVWSADTGRTDRGIAVAAGIVFVANGRELHALRTDTGERYWTHEIGGWQHTAPAYGRETVFVGGDRLRAFDPAPRDDPSNGPALRFERTFAGRVGPGPVIDNGVLYVVAEVEDGEYALVALE
ncbi:PQQ-like beta-propeller repeat protein [Natronorubrum bangense]|uniref:Pyrrolo-quinoline quinone n=2 Tax=Natronorubrum bangense TaxID=61858 RepID=L9W623_9EURY|nr:PQQ-binding-like beta-propeller repeat protein [Natronorubrum bangense]ELY44909.1 pyrrolo-quinoline quinone [Natronorubrum bangense JCM 10635]QCC55002.1 pyrrolo-quinoline quinone [Natronorubrum bangense]